MFLTRSNSSSIVSFRSISTIGGSSCPAGRTSILSPSFKPRAAASFAGRRIARLFPHLETRTSIAQLQIYINQDVYLGTSQLGSKRRHYEGKQQWARLPASWN